MADQISDAILDAMIKDDPESRVAVETLITTGQVHVAGEVTTETYVDIPGIIREKILEIGYDSSPRDTTARRAACRCRSAPSRRTSPRACSDAFEYREGEGSPTWTVRGRATRGSCSVTPAARRRN